MEVVTQAQRPPRAAARRGIGRHACGWIVAAAAAAMALAVPLAASAQDTGAPPHLSAQTELICSLIVTPIQKLILDLIGLLITMTITFAIRLLHGSPSSPSQFRLAPALRETAASTPPRPLIPPSQRRREGSADGVAKNRPQKRQGWASSEKQISMMVQAQ